LLAGRRADLVVDHVERGGADVVGGDVEQARIELGAELLRIIVDEAGERDTPDAGEQGAHVGQPRIGLLDLGAGLGEEAGGVIHRFEAVGVGGAGKPGLRRRATRSSATPSSMPSRQSRPSSGRA
jgi:hypothetical protein